MKIKPEHAAHITAELTRVFNTLTPATVRKHHNELAAKDVDKRVRWDLLHTANLIPWLCATVYHYADDAHIDTVLRAAMRGLPY